MNPITQDQFFSQLFQTGLSDPNSKVYLPGLILQSSNPSLNPYTVASIDLGNQDFGSGIQMDIKLANMAISNVANVSVAASNGGTVQLAGLNAVMLGQFCTLNPPPPNVGSVLSLTTDFTLSNPNAGTLNGSFSVTISAGAINSVFTVSGQNFDDITITFTSVTVSVPSSVTVNPTITFQGGGGGFWANLFQNYLKQESSIQMIVGQVNTVIGGNLAQLSSEITTLVQNALKQQLG